MNAISLWKGPIEVSAPKPTMREIASEVADAYGLTLDDLKGDCRARMYAWPRQEAMARIYATGRFSQPQIGRFFGGRDHTTVHHALRAVERRAAE